MTTIIDREMSNAVYHKKQAIGSSGLKLLKRSPAHYWAAYINPDREERQQTPAQLLGSAVHMAFLEKSLFDESYIVLPDGIDRRSKDGKALYEEIIATGKTPIPEPMWKKIKLMVASAESLDFSQLLSGITVNEASIFWTDEDSGVDCKIRPDAYLLPCPMFPNGLIIDLKTCGDASPDGFAKNAWNSDMHLQAALYCMGYQNFFKPVLKTDGFPRFMWLAIEAESPFACAYHEAPEYLIDYGCEKVRELLALYSECKKNNHWPAYEERNMLELPNYAMRTIEGNNEEVEVSYVD